MTREKWENLIIMVKEKFGISDQRTEDLDPVGEVEIVEFEGPLGLMKFERTTKPRVLDKKTTYSRRIGSGVEVEYIYSENEVIHTFGAYKWDDHQEGWVKINAESFVT